MWDDSMNSPKEYITIPEKFGDEEIDVIYYRSTPLDAPLETKLPGTGIYPSLDPHTYVENGIRVDQDVAVKLRDGVTIYVDVYRPDGPAGEKDLPAILSWSYYGKRSNLPGQDNFTPRRSPGHVLRTCACSRVRTRPTGASRATRSSTSTVAEWAIQRATSAGSASRTAKTATTSSSGSPPSPGPTAKWACTAIRHWPCPSGGSPPSSRPTSPASLPGKGAPISTGSTSPTTASPQSASTGSSGPSSAGAGYIVDNVAMLEEYPLMNAYWESKIPDFEKVTVPAYITAGWNHIHLRGAMNAYMNISSQKKWLRAHREFEWPDGYMWWNMEDLKRFFDRYLKGIRNGWEATPPVRIDVMDAYDYDFQVARPEREFPLARTEYQKLYLDAAEWQPYVRSRSRPTPRPTYDARKGGRPSTSPSRKTSS